MLDNSPQTPDTPAIEVLIENRCALINILERAIELHSGASNAEADVAENSRKAINKLEQFLCHLRCIQHENNCKPELEQEILSFYKKYSEAQDCTLLQLTMHMS